MDNDIAIATGKASDNAFNTPRSSSASKMSTDSTSTPQFTDTDTSGRKKRSRAETADTTTQNRPPTPEDVPRASKRRRDPTEGDTTSAPYASPGSPETEDISAEVQRRLRIREERRRKKENAKPEKRKRDSLASNDGASTGGATHRKKRARRTSSDLKRDGDTLADKEADAKTKRLRKTHTWN
ncbi:hypothetical protein PENSUB_952 [Penicillium subrubescens]|jgi:hypothetical protein|uniref:Uncharacterized protein n=1 Tax=Penicillium subrubescens TaxID=1316194 RepID=A0A1Q5ULK9_9EURO|nr:hypothetical protein PENSUB_952 [Penicillium subrubescens]